MNWEEQWQLNKRAYIREAECIGCTKCIQACPVDAILGATKLMHTVISDECTGCQLCVAPCPVDCIDMIDAPIKEDVEAQKNKFRVRHLAHEARMQQEKTERPLREAVNKDVSLEAKKSYIEAAILRAKERKKR